MDRATADKINNDSEIVRLRMEAEDLINNVESFSEDEFKVESKRIETELEQRFAVLYKEYR